jgi:hypothetical protein
MIILFLKHIKIKVKIAYKDIEFKFLNLLTLNPSAALRATP